MLYSGIRRRAGTFIRRAGLIMIVVLVLAGALLPATASAAPAQAAPAQASYGSYYAVRAGDNLTRIAIRFGTTVRAIMDANGLYSSVILVGQVLFIPGGGGGHSCAQSHYVQRGDTLTGIARWFGVSIYELARVNNIHNYSRIYVGQRLCIPSGYYPPSPGPKPIPPAPVCGQYYTVQRGDTLSAIARWCGTSVRSLAYINDLYNPSHIFVGQKLRIY